MKKAVVIFILILIISSCYVCDTYYSLEGSEAPYIEFHDSIITLSAWSAPSVKDWVEFYIRFDKSDAFEVKDINMVFLSGSKLLELDYISAENSKLKIDQNNSRPLRFTKFQEIPQELRWTTIKKEQSIYIFCFKSDSADIRYLASKLILRVLLKHGSRSIVLKKQYSVQGKKSCSFRVH